MFESVNRWTDGRTPARLVYYKLTSGELKIQTVLEIKVPITVFEIKRLVCYNKNQISSLLI